MGQLFPYSFAPLRPLGFASVEVSTTVVSTLTVPPGTKGALLQATGGKLNWRGDSDAPTNAAGGGMVLEADAEPTWFQGPLNDLQFIAADASTFLPVSFYG